MRNGWITLFLLACQPPVERPRDPIGPIDTDPPVAPAPLALTAADPAIVDPLGGSEVVLTGVGFAATADHPAVQRVAVGGLDATSFTVVSDTELRFVSPPVASGGVSVTV